MIHFCFDDIESSPTLGYPNLAKSQLSADQFDHEWPRSIPLRLLMYLRRAEIEFQVHGVKDAPLGSWYPVALGWHDHDLDYFALMPDIVLNRLRRREIKVFFYYHEGDNPKIIHDIMESCREKNQLPRNCYLFCTANSKADELENFCYFDDHEHFFRYINRRQDYVLASELPRSHDFTALNRTHKWWRAGAMSDLMSLGVLENSFWSYNTNCLIDDCEKNCPLELDSRPGWRQDLERFLTAGPYHCDHFDARQHNDHRKVNHHLYTDSYCHLVFETHFDADGSQGAFLTEKTYKCIKYGQPFVMIGTPGSLGILRKKGYKVFDHALDNSYDVMINNTERWKTLRQLIKKLAEIDLHDWYLSCLNDVKHNQILFEKRQKGTDLLELAHRLSADHSHTV